MFADDPMTSRIRPRAASRRPATRAVTYACVSVRRRTRRGGGLDVVTRERFSEGMTFAEYLEFCGSPANLAREGFDVRKFSVVRPRINWSRWLHERYGSARLTDAQSAAMRWLAAQPR